MRTFSLNLLAACLLTSFQAYAEEASADQVPAQTQTYEQPAAPFQPFTGKVVKNKVESYVHSPTWMRPSFAS